VSPPDFALNGHPIVKAARIAQRKSGEELTTMAVGSGL
jgi:hypothetical protein